jgi:ribosomal 50S subunit-associated protein YjgA (DUF615 family)
MTIEAMLEVIRSMPAPDRRRLLELIAETLPEAADTEAPKRSLRELRGLGKALWQGVDAQAYVNDLRREWDEGE